MGGYLRAYVHAHVQAMRMYVCACFSCASTCECECVSAYNSYIYMIFLFASSHDDFIGSTLLSGALSSTFVPSIPFSSPVTIYHHIHLHLS